MRLRVGFAPLVLLVCACPGDPIEASGTVGNESTTGTGESDSLTSNATLTSSASMTMSSDSMESSGPSTTAPTSDPSETDPSTTEPTSDPSETDPSTTEPTSDPTVTDPTTTESTSDPTTTTDPSTTESTTESETDEECEGDEAELHQTPEDALELDSLACDDGALAGAGVIDDATWQDWWWFYGFDPNGGCEPDAVRVEVTAGGPMPLCVYASCGVSCTTGAADGAMGCCGTDLVELAVDCGGSMDDSTAVAILFGDGTEECVPITFEYEF